MESISVSDAAFPPYDRLKIYELLFSFNRKQIIIGSAVPCQYQIDPISNRKAVASGRASHKLNAHLTFGFARSITWHSRLAGLGSGVRIGDLYRQLSECCHPPRTE